MIHGQHKATRARVWIFPIHRFIVSGRLLRKNSCAVPKVSERKPIDFSMPWIAARTKASSSMTNTVGEPAGVNHWPRLWWVELGESSRHAESYRQPTSGRHAIQRWSG